MSSSSESWEPSIEEICDTLSDCADRISRSADTSIEPYVHQRLHDLTLHLAGHCIPGFDPPPDRETADALTRAAQMALDRADEREALSRALRGLACAPHDPVLWYLASGACFEFGSVDLAIRLLNHTIWIHPGHRAARAELEALSAFLDDADEQ